MSTETPGATSRKRARSPLGPPIVLDYRPYTGRQLTPSLTAHKQQWDLYYRNNTINGYKDRHYLLREFCELNEAIMEASRTEAEAAPTTTTTSKSISWMEAGCGVGNAMLPVFDEYGTLAAWDRLVGFDISSVAIQLLQAKRAALPRVLQEKLHVCVLDPTASDVADCPFFRKLPSSSSSPAAGRVTVANPVRFVSMVFVLCSIPVSSHARVLARIAACMENPGGVFFFRDYAAEDQAQKRFRSRTATRGGAPIQPASTAVVEQKGGPDVERQEEEEEDGPDMAAADDNGNTYTRANGTLSHFFTIEEVRALFEGAGFDVIELRLVEVEVTNRKKGLRFDRRFVQGRFRIKDV